LPLFAVPPEALFPMVWGTPALPPTATPPVALPPVAWTPPVLPPAGVSLEHPPAHAAPVKQVSSARRHRDSLSRGLADWQRWRIVRWQSVMLCSSCLAACQLSMEGTSTRSRAKTPESAISEVASLAAERQVKQTPACHHAAAHQGRRAANSFNGTHPIGSTASWPGDARPPTGGRGQISSRGLDQLSERPAWTGLLWARWGAPPPRPPEPPSGPSDRRLPTQSVGRPI
jgi:hypothetical protein